MKRLAFLALAPVVLAACTPLHLPISQTAETAQTAEVAAPATAEEPSASATPSPAPSAWPGTLQAMDLAVLPYDEIRQVYTYSLFDFPASGYYTMCQGGLWGLMRNDGSEVLPCTFDKPIAQCSDSTADVPAWIAAKEGADPAFWGETGQYLASVGEGRICDTAHCGPGYKYYFWDESQKQMFAYIGNLGPSVPSHITPAMQAECGWWFPTRAGTLTQTDWGLDVDFDTNAPYRYRSADGTPLNNYEYEQAGLFYDGALLAAARRGSKWVYLDGSGREVTAPCYDPVYWNTWSDIGYASPLLNGYAAVCRDGKYGLLDSAGLEYLPCAYDGVAWDGGVGWLKLADGWHAFRIPTAAQQTSYPPPTTQDDLRDVPLTTIFPDTYPGSTQWVNHTTIWDDNLNVRAGPGTDYEKIGSIPPGSPVKELGSSSTVDGWTFVLYQDWLRGWVSSKYLE